MTEEKNWRKLFGEQRKLAFRIHELEAELRRVRVVMKDAAAEALEVRNVLEAGMTQRAGVYAGALYKKLEVERTSGPVI
jgi:hypothetical protein